MLRAIVLSLMLITAVSATLPIGESYARWKGDTSVNARQRHGKHYQRNRRAWLRRKRAQQRRQRALAAWRKRQQQAMQSTSTSNQNPELAKLQTTQLPQGWTMIKATGGETRYLMRDARGAESNIVLSSLTSPTPNTLQAETRRRALGGIAHTDLRRRVIDRMISEGGYVTNDMEKIVGGQKAFVVIAETKQAGVARSVNYYFVEVGGGVYSIATDSTSDNLKPVAAQVESVVAALRTKQTQTFAKSFE